MAGVIDAAWYIPPTRRSYSRYTATPAVAVLQYAYCIKYHGFVVAHALLGIARLPPDHVIPECRRQVYCQVVISARIHMGSGNITIRHQE